MQKLFYSLVVLLAVSACGNQPAAETANEPAGHSSHAGETPEPTAALGTDQGKKWQADEATIQGIRQMSATAAAGRAGTLQGKALADSLSANFADIFKKCTMKGAAHDQLHLYLQPLKQQLDALKGGADETKLVNEMLDHLAKFDQYFE